MNNPTKEDFIIIIKHLIIQITKHYNYTKIYNHNFLKEYIRINIDIIACIHSLDTSKLNRIQNFILINIEEKVKLPISQTSILVELIHLLQYITENSIRTILNLNIIQVSNE